MGNSGSHDSSTITEYRLLEYTERILHNISRTNIYSFNEIIENEEPYLLKHVCLASLSQHYMSIKQPQKE